MQFGQVVNVTATFVEDKGGRAVVRLPSGTKTTLPYEAVDPRRGRAQFVAALEGPGGTVYCNRCEWSDLFTTWADGADGLAEHDAEVHP